MRIVANFALALGIVAGACGETRYSLGEECLRSEDCLSGVCSGRACVAAPPVGVGFGSTPPDETARIPSADAAPAADASLGAEAGADGGDGG